MVKRPPPAATVVVCDGCLSAHEQKPSRVGPVHLGSGEQLRVLGQQLLEVLLRLVRHRDELCERRSLSRPIEDDVVVHDVLLVLGEGGAFVRPRHPGTHDLGPPERHRR